MFSELTFHIPKCDIAALNRNNPISGLKICFLYYIILYYILNEYKHVAILGFFSKPTILLNQLNVLGHIIQM